MNTAAAVIAVLLSVAGDVVTIAELEHFSDAASCHAYAARELPRYQRIGAAGIGCAERTQARVVTMKFFGTLRGTR